MRGSPEARGTNSASLRVSWVAHPLPGPGQVSHKAGPVCLSVLPVSRLLTTTAAAAVPHRTLRGSGAGYSAPLPHRPGPGALHPLCRPPASGPLSGAALLGGASESV